MNRRLIRLATYVQLVVMTLVATGCAPTQPFFLNESSSLQHYIDHSIEIENPDVMPTSLAETTEALPPLMLGNHRYEWWDLRLEECIAIALQNSRFLMTVGGIAEQRQNVIEQFASGRADQFSSIYDVARQQSLTQSIPLTVDGNGNRILGRGVQNANQVGGVEDALAEFDAQVSSVWSYGTTDRPRNIDQPNQFNRQLFQQRDGLQQTAISKRLATGGVVSVREQILYQGNNLPVGQNGLGRDVSSDWTAILEAQITHPLMRGRGALVNRIPLVLASINEDISVADFEAQVRNLVYDVEQLYWDLYFAYRNVEAEKVGRDSALSIYQTNRDLLSGGNASLVEISQAEARYAEFRSRLQGALSSSNLPGADPRGVYGIERELRGRMGLSPSDGRLIRPIDAPTLAYVDFDWFESQTIALYRHPELRRSRFELKQRELEILQAKNQLLPQVDLSLIGRLVGVGDELGLGSRNGTNFPDPLPNQGAVGSSAVAGLTEGNFAEFTARLEITPTPIGQRRELARIRNAKLDYAHQKAFIEDQELALTNRLQQAMAELQTHYHQIQSNALALMATERELAIRSELVKEGRDRLEFLLQAQTTRANAQNSYYRAITEYNKSIAYVHYVRGTLLDFNSIELQEGPWPQKAYWDALERARERSAGYVYRYGYTRPNVVRTGPVGTASPSVFVDPAALPETGIADGLILGEEPFEVEIWSHDSEAVGSGLPSVTAPQLQNIEEMPSLQMPQGPHTETIPAPQPNVGSGLRGTGRQVDQASFESDSGLDNAPRVKRQSLPPVRKLNAHPQ